ncbi:cyclase family protein [Nonlabens agnitus]|uniref:Metal-dependent hydrolase n=1 Tax=Nonlabens agnitus TaxID=870484 RepID=A0A2S9WY78_9FLAO|nr:cyclase family protein [Nonlabens agnitus]PRP68422.1 metal-dependent hydrolase [Nonlabens agnitus]
METTLFIDDKPLSIDLNNPIDISLAVQNNAGVGAWYIDQPKITHVEVDGYVGKVSMGGSTNFNDVFFNPHSHGTHTECIGHITEEFHSVNNALEKSFFTAQLITVTPENRDGDQVIRAAMFEDLDKVDAVIIRTLPNTDDKKSKNYSNTNPPYLMEEVMLRFRESGIQHVLIDLPSVDKERDNGALLAHKAFWDFDGNQRLNATITELIYVPSAVADGKYILDLQVAPIENDAAPSRPILYAIKS